MDLTLADVTGLSRVSVGDEVILLGSLDGLSLDAREHASLAETSRMKFSAESPSACRGSTGDGRRSFVVGRWSFAALLA
jgi:alanine racemase